MDRPDNIPYPSRAGGKLFNLWQDAEHPRGVWRRCSTLESFRSEAPDWDVLLDLDALAAEENEDWFLKSAALLPGTHDRAILSLSRGGADAVVLREFDLATRRFLPDGFRLPEGKSWVAWLDRDTLLLMSTVGPGMATNAGYARTVRLWRRGTDPLAAPVIFQVPAESVVRLRRRRSRQPGRAPLVCRESLVSSTPSCGSATAPARRRGSMFRAMPGCRGSAVGSP